MSKARRYQHFGLIVFMDFLCAWYDTCFGPIIPYYSAATGIDETDYSYLFMVKSAANIFGSILLSVIIEKLSTQKLLILYLLIATAALILSSLSLTTVNLSLTIFFATLTILSATDIAYLITVSLFLGNQPQYWVQVLQFFYIAGAIGGQFFVMIFQIKSFMVLGLAFLMPVIGLLFLPVPDVKEEEEQQGAGIKISKKTKVYMTLIFFLFATLELTIGSWLPTYAIKAGVTDTKGSALFTSLFWITNCVVKVFWVYLPGTVQAKLDISLKLMLLSAVAAWGFQELQLFQLVCYFTPISIGITSSGVYGFLLSWVVDNGFAFSPQDNIVILLGYSLGQGLLLTPVGYLMGFFGFKFLNIFNAICSVGIYIVFLLVASSMEDDKNQYRILYAQQGRQNGIE